ncbi:hypothetical protein KC19_6G167200 [Ceratodon purpureus]|uniref:Uncharacterized protein n=1 Tax=Ceratodon purpureus TaxID=3225 RepID=A0A8T0HFF7_CERPU|nr:hypothetical protein KC19_6G167200 [Ceratodon purpureus]
MQTLQATRKAIYSLNGKITIHPVRLLTLKLFLTPTKHQQHTRACKLTSIQASQPSRTLLQVPHDSLESLELLGAAPIHTPNLVLTKPAGLFVHVLLLNAIQGLEHLRLHTTEARPLRMNLAGPSGLIKIDAPPIWADHTAVQRSLCRVRQNLFNRRVVRPLIQNAASSTILHTRPSRARRPYEVTDTTLVRRIPAAPWLGRLGRFLPRPREYCHCTGLRSQETPLRSVDVEKRSLADAPAHAHAQAEAPRREPGGWPEQSGRHRHTRRDNFTPATRTSISMNSCSLRSMSVT